MLNGRNLSFLKESTGGIFQLNFSLRERQCIFFQTENPEQSKSLNWLLSGKVGPQSGVLENREKKYIQSDRWFLEQERLIESTAEKWLNLSSPFFRFQGMRKVKLDWLQKFSASRFLHTPVFRLKGEELNHFVLLSLCFQEEGYLILSEFWNYPLSDPAREIFEKLLEQPGPGICLIDHRDLSDKIRIPKETQVIEVKSQPIG